jgi:P pilus assembly chaperone PapD
MTLRGVSSSHGLAIFLCLLMTHTSVVVVSAKPKAKAKRIPTKIVLVKDEVDIAPRKNVKVHATVLDQKGDPISDAKVTWQPPSGSLPVSFAKSLDDAEANTIIISGPSTEPSVSEVMDIRVNVFSSTNDKASSTLLVHYRSVTGVVAPTVIPTEIAFKQEPSGTLFADGKMTVTAVVKDKDSVTVPGAKVKWSLEPKSEIEKFIALGPSDDQKNSIVLFGRGVADEKNAPTSVTLIATSGPAVGILRIDYKSGPPKTTGDLILTPPEFEIGPTQSQNFKVSVKNGTAPSEAARVEISDEDKVYVEIKRNTSTEATKEDEFTVTGRSVGPSATLPRTVRVKVSKNGIQDVLLVRFKSSLNVSWTVLPPQIVGDLYGRTIKSHYYCIEVTIDNQTGSGVALNGFQFTLDGETRQSPSTMYDTVHGSLSRRKLTHPRTLTLAIISSVGNLMTGFNPFFHNLNHATNYSRFIDIISNPLEKGTALVWPDSYPDELARLEGSAVLHEEKIVVDKQVFRTKIFFPKQSLYLKDDERNDLKKVTKALGTLGVSGYQLGNQIGGSRAGDNPPKN